MAAPKGHPRYGGRSKGTPNKKTQLLEDKCREKGLDPFEVLLEYLTPATEPQMRFNAAKELCQYLYPKRKAVEGELFLVLKELLGMSEQDLKEAAGD